MEAKIKEPVIERDVIIKMTESEAKEIRNFIGGTCVDSRKNSSNNTFNDYVVTDFYAVIEKALE